MSDFDFSQGLFGGSSAAAEEAAAIQAGTGQQAIEEQRRQFDIIQENLRPYREVGGDAYQQQLSSQLEGGMLPVDPGAQFRNQLQARELNRNLAARGQLGGGNRLRALQSQSMAQQMQDESNQFQRLGALSGRGSGATSELGQAGSQFAGTIGQTMTDIANAQASGLIGAQNANQQTAGGIASAAGALVGLFSDAELKVNIKEIDNALDRVCLLNGVTWDWQESGEGGSGVIAQEVKRVLPEAVKMNGEFLTVDYTGIIGALVNSVKELKQEIETLKGEQDG